MCLLLKSSFCPWAEHFSYRCASADEFTRPEVTLTTLSPFPKTRVASEVSSQHGHPSAAENNKEILSHRSGDKTRYSDGGPPARWSGHFTRVSCSVCSAARITNTPALLVRGGTQPATVRGCRSHTHSAGQIAPILMIIDPRSKTMEENEKASCSYQRARQGRTRRWKCRIGNDGWEKEPECMRN